MDFKIHKIYYKSSFNRKKLYAKLYIPDGEIKGCVQIIHGMNDHINRYKDIMKYLAKSGYVCFGSDLLGHGRSIKYPSELGYFAEELGYKYLINDSHRLLRIIKSKYPNKPMFILGHDMGSFIAKLCASKYKNDVKGIILSGTCSNKRYAPLAIKGLDELIEKRGSHYRSNIIDKSIATVYNHKYVSPIAKKDFLSRERTVINSVLGDPLCNFTYTLLGLKDIYTLFYYANQKSWYKAIDQNLSVLILTGDMDPVGGFGKGGKEIYDKLMKNEICDISLNIYPGARHEVLNEINRYEVFLDIKKWLDDTLEIWNYK